MATDIPQRLAAIVAADIADYTRLMELNEAGIVAAWRQARAEVIDPLVAEHRGRIVKLTGDGFLAEFPTAESAVKAALAMQTALAVLFGARPQGRVAFRMGVNVGDIWVDAEDIYGAGVNVAARLEGLAEPGGICISDSVRDVIKHKVAGHYEDLGLQRVKNVAEPIRAWRLKAAEAPQPAAPRRRDATRRALGGYAVTAVLAASLAAGVYWFLSRDTDARWLRDQAVPEIETHLQAGDFEAAYSVAKEAEARVPSSVELAELWPRIAWLVTIPSDPPGATVFRRDYDDTEAMWEELGRTPLEDVRIPFGLSQLRFELEGHLPLLRALGGGVLVQSHLSTRAGRDVRDFWVAPDAFKLDTVGTLPEGKVRIPGWTEALDSDLVQFNDFFLGRYEVTNAEFKSFVDGSGYRNRAYWEEPIVDNGEVIPWEEAMERFTDRTDRPGPSTWEAGDYPEDQGAFPVGGVSWYEAAAYARFVGQELPTVRHWRRGLALGTLPWLLPLSNFGVQGPRAVTESRAMSDAGAFDMLGNVREWSATAVGDQRVVLGSAWNEAYYPRPEGNSVAPPIDRSASNGIRLAITDDDPGVAMRARAPMLPLPAPQEWDPVSDDVYAAYGRIFAYDAAPLNESIDATDTTRAWIRERISFDAAYGSERMVLYLYLPTDGEPPYQTVIYWPGSTARALNSIDEYSTYLDFIVKNGRAVAFPVYEGTFERGDRTPLPPFDSTAYRDNVVEGVKDLRRSIDYLESRADIDRNALAFFGHSWGALNGATALAQEPRIKTAVVYVGFLSPVPMDPEVDPINALPRVKIPTIMLSGEFDSGVPIDVARRYFELIGTREPDKNHVIAPGGHFVPRDILIRETLNWLDSQLGSPRS